MPKNPADIVRLKNLGPASREWLKAIGITTLDDLKALGAVEVYFRLRDRGFPVSLNMVYAVQGAIMGVHWNALPGELRDELKVAVRLRELERETP